MYNKKIRTNKREYEIVKRILEDEEENIRDFLKETRKINRTEEKLCIKSTDFIKENYTLTDDGKTIVAWSDSSAHNKKAGTGIYFAKNSTMNDSFRTVGKQEIINYLLKKVALFFKIANPKKKTEIL